MNEAAVIFLKWWNTMALMYERYGDAADIEEKPEWAELQQLQQGWLDVLVESTGSDPDVLFDKIDRTIADVLGISGTAVSLDFEKAQEIMHKAVARVIETEVEIARSEGVVN